MKENLVQSKSFAFSLRMVKLYQFMNDEKKEFVLSKQILRSGTSLIAKNCSFLISNC
jgi:four helix bundle protein